MGAQPQDKLTGINWTSAVSCPDQTFADAGFAAQTIDLFGLHRSNKPV